MAEAEVKKRTRRTKKTPQEAAPEAASPASGAPKTPTQTNPDVQVTKLPNGLVVVSR